MSQLRTWQRRHADAVVAEVCPVPGMGTWEACARLIATGVERQVGLHFSLLTDAQGGGRHPRAGDAPARLRGAVRAVGRDRAPQDPALKGGSGRAGGGQGNRPKRCGNQNDTS
jgi:hypothetical protein